jgi:hypothetical protein
MFNQYNGMRMKQMVAKRLAPINPNGINYTTVPQSAQESARNYAIAANLRAKDFMGNIVTRVTLPWDAPKTVTEQDDRARYVKQAQTQRQVAFMRQSAMPWGSAFMVTPTDGARLNNPAQISLVTQRQLTTPSTYGQFYAFMHAMSAAFGQLQ